MGKLLQAFIQILLMVGAGTGSFFLFYIRNDWKFLLGGTCVGELLCMLFGGLSAFLLVQHYNTKETRLTKKQTLLLLALNYLSLIMPLCVYLGHNLLGTILIIQFVHLVTTIMLLIEVRQPIHFATLYGYMVFCSPIIYRISSTIVPPPSWDGEAQGVANFAMLTSVTVLLIFGALLLCGRHLKHDQQNP